MTSNDPITAIVDQLAAHAEQLTRLDARHADHHAAVSARLAELTGQTAALGHVVEEHAAALARLTAPSQTDPDGDGYRPEPAPAWWKLRGRRPAGTHRPAAGLGRAGLPARLRAPGRRPRPLLARPRPVPVRAGHRRPSCGRCCTCSPDRSPGLVSAQAEYQARILPALADQLRTETNTCGHPRSPAPASGQPWSRP